MTINFMILVFMWLLPLTSGQTNAFSHVTTGTQVTPSESTQDQPTTREASSLEPVTGFEGRHVTRSIVVQENGTKPSGEPSSQTTATTTSKMFAPGIPTAATPTSSTWSRFNGSTEGVKSTMEILLNFTTSAATVAPSHTSNTTTTTGAPPTPSSSAHTQSSDGETTRPSTLPTPSTSLVSTTKASTEPVENKTAIAIPVTATFRTSKATTKTPSVHVPKRKDRLPGGKEKPAKGSNHGKIVAGLIGGALVAMMVGFLIIYIKKRKLQKQQITTSDWAGPSPFLEGGANNGRVSMRSSNRISLSRFLTQRMSKRLSTLPDTELEDLTPATSTFGGGNDGGESNGTAGVVPETRSNGDAPVEMVEMVETVEMVDVSLTNETPHTDNNSEVANHIQDLSANPPTPSGLS